jgi:FkbM family methyltransferase
VGIFFFFGGVFFFGDMAASGMPVISGAPTSRVLLETDDGLSFIAPRRAKSEAEFLYEEIFVRRSYLQEGVSLIEAGHPIVVDAGANIGLFALLCMRINPCTRVIACEPSPDSYALLSRNVAGYDSVKTLPLALGAGHGIANLYCYGDAPAESSTRPAERERQRQRLSCEISRRDPAPPVHASESGLFSEPAVEATPSVVRCEVRSLSWLMCEESLPVIDLLKVDVEGDELEVLRGVRSSDWSRIRQVVVEVHDVNGRLARVLSLLRRHGMRAKAVQQRGGVRDGYQMVVPHGLRLFYVYATRRDGEEAALSSSRVQTAAAPAPTAYRRPGPRAPRLRSIRKKPAAKALQ